MVLGGQEKNRKTYLSNQKTTLDLFNTHETGKIVFGSLSLINVNLMDIRQEIIVSKWLTDGKPCL